MTDIIEGNRLIAEFDGYDIHMNGYQYHSSWDWLMPVVEKIHLLREVTEFSIRPGSTRIWLKKAHLFKALLILIMILLQNVGLQ